MLTFSFFTAVFLSISWIIYIGTYIYSRVQGISLPALGLVDIAVYTALAAAPLFVIWTMWNAFYRLRTENSRWRQAKNFEAKLAEQQEFMATVARLLYQNQKNSEKNFFLSQTELFIGELNGLLADMLHRYNFITDTEAARLWTTAEKGNKWGFAKALINLQNTSVDFDRRLYRTAVKENLLRGAINEFCARYARLIELLKIYDREKVFLEIIETGAFGKAFAILAPLSDRLQQETAVKAAAEKEPELFADNTLRIADTASLRETETTADANEEKEEKLPENEPTANDELPAFLATDDEPPALGADQNPAEENGEDENDETDSDVITPAENKAPAAEEEAALQTTNPSAEGKESAPAATGEKETPQEDRLEEEISRMFAGAGVRGEDDDNDDASVFPKFSSLFKRRGGQKKKAEADGNGIDPLTLALERSFGKLAEDAPNTNSRLEKIFNAETPAEENGENGVADKYSFTGTNESLIKLQRELEELTTEKTADAAATETGRETAADNNAQKEEADAPKADA